MPFNSLKDIHEMVYREMMGLALQNNVHDKHLVIVSNNIKQIEQVLKVYENKDDPVNIYKTYLKGLYSEEILNLFEFTPTLIERVQTVIEHTQYDELAADMKEAYFWPDQLQIVLESLHVQLEILQLEIEEANNG